MFAKRWVVGGLLAAVLLAQGAAWAQPTAEPGLIEMAARRQATRHELLLSHGVETTPGAILAFLDRGFGDDIESQGLPQSPRAKTDVLIAGIEELGYQRAAEAAPVLAEIVDDRFPAGAAGVIARDAENLPIEEAETRVADYRRVVRLNAVVALGLIGDASAAPSVRRAMVGDEVGGFVTEGAIALALMDDPSGLAAVAGLATRASEDIIEGVYTAVFIVSGRNYGITPQSSPARRREAAQQLGEWTAANAATMPLSRRDILRRRAEGYRVPAPPLETLRGALKASRDPRNYDARYAARTRLQTLVPGSLPEVRAIVEDESEDIDIRWAAMEWFAASEPRQARKVLDRIADRDEVPTIRERARVLLEDIRQALAAEKEKTG